MLLLVLLLLYIIKHKYYYYHYPPADASADFGIRPPSPYQRSDLFYLKLEANLHRKIRQSKKIQRVKGDSQDPSRIWDVIGA